MVQQMEEEVGLTFVAGEHVDCLDTVNKWCNAEVVQVDAAGSRVFVHYSGYHKKYDEWVSYADDHVANVQVRV